MDSSKRVLNLKEKVFAVVKRIPYGQVATYGGIARILNIKARTVGWMMHLNTSVDVPCHRVVDRNGRLAPNFAFDGAKEQKRRLEAEGVKFVDQMHVDFDSCLWQEQFEIFNQFLKFKYLIFNKQSFSLNKNLKFRIKN